MEVTLDRLTRVHTLTDTHTHRAHADAAHFQTSEPETVPLFFTIFPVITTL